MTASDVLELIKKNLGSPWNESTYRDVFHAGDPKVEVKGIATTFMATLDLLQRAHAAGMNLIIPHETTFWNDRDDTKDMAAMRCTGSRSTSARRIRWPYCGCMIMRTRTGPISS